MPKTTNYTNVSNVLIVIDVNREHVTDNGYEYQPITVECRVDALTSEGAQRPVKKVLEVGPMVSQPVDLKQIYTRINSVNSGLGALFKSAILEAINEDPSA